VIDSLRFNDFFFHYKECLFILIQIKTFNFRICFFSLVLMYGDETQFSPQVELMFFDEHY